MECSAMITVQHQAYCGMSSVPHAFDTLPDARAYVAHKLARLRRRYPIITHVNGSEWEVCEPNDCAMVPDACGVLRLNHITVECRECGSACETEHDARACCYEDRY